MGTKNLSTDQKTEIEYFFEECYKDDAQKNLRNSLPFLESLHNYYDRTGFLSEKQIKSLRDLYERATG